MWITSAPHLLPRVAAGCLAAVLACVMPSKVTAADAGATLTEQAAQQIKQAVNTLSIASPGQQGQFLLRNWDLVVELHKSPAKFPAFRLSSQQIDLLDQFKRARLYSLQEQFLRKLATDDPGMVAHVRGFMKTGSWAKSNNPNYIKLISDFDMTIVCDDPTLESKVSQQLRAFLHANDFDLRKMNSTVFPVPVGSGQESEVYEGGAKKFVDVYNDTEGRFDAVQFDSGGRYRGISRNQSPEASFGVVYDTRNGKKIRVVQSFAKFTPKDAPDLMLKEQEDFITFAKSFKDSGKTLSKSDMKKIGKFTSRSAWGHKILSREPVYSNVARKAFDLKWNNVDPEDLLADRIEHFMSSGKAGTRDAAVQLAYREYLHEAGEMVHRNADVASNVKRFGLAVAEDVGQQAPLYARLLQHMDKLQYFTALYAIYQSYSTSPPGERATNASFTTAKELAELSMPGLSWPFLTATITHAALTTTAESVYGAYNQKAAELMFVGIFDGDELLRMTPAQIEARIEDRYASLDFNPEAVGGLANMYTQWRQGNKKEMKDLIYWTAIRTRAALVHAHKEQQRAEQLDKDMQRIIDALTADAEGRDWGGVDLSRDADGEATLAAMRQTEADEATRWRAELAKRYAEAEKLAETAATPSASTDAPVVATAPAQAAVTGAEPTPSGVRLTITTETRTAPDRTGYQHTLMAAHPVGEPDRFTWMQPKPVFARQLTFAGQAAALVGVDQPTPDHDLAQTLERFYPDHRPGPVLTLDVRDPSDSPVLRQTASLGWARVALRIDLGYKDLAEYLRRQDALIAAAIRQADDDLKAAQSARQKEIADAQRTFNAVQSRDKKDLEFELEGCELKRRYEGVQKRALPAKQPDASHDASLPSLEPEYEWIKGEKRVDPLMSSCDGIREQIQDVERRSFDPSPINRRYVKIERGIVERRDKQIARLQAGREQASSRNEDLASAARQVVDEAVKSSAAPSQQCSSTLGRLTDERVILLCRLEELVNEHRAALVYSVIYPPRINLWSTRMESVHGYLRIGGRTVPLTNRKAAIQVTLTVDGGGGVPQVLSIPLLDEHYDRFAAGDRELWAAQVERINNRITRFLNAHRGETSPVQTARIEQLKALYSSEPTPSAQQFYARFGMDSAFNDALNFTAAMLSKGEAEGLAGIDAKWAALYAAAEKKVYALATEVDRPVAAGAAGVSVGAAPGKAGEGPAATAMTSGGSQSAVEAARQAIDDGSDPNTLVREIQARIDDEVRQALAAMDFMQDCADRVAARFQTIGTQMQSLTAILEAKGAIGRLEPDLKTQLAQWTSRNLASHQNLIETAEKVKGISLQDIPASITNAKVRRRLEDQRTKMINMKKTYAASLPAIQTSHRLLSRCNQLLGSPPPPPAAEQPDAQEQNIRNKARQMIESLNKDF